MEGIAIVIFTTAGKFFVKAGTFGGKLLDVAKLKKGSTESIIFATIVPKIIPIMRYVRIPQAEYYFSDGKLVDVRLSESKFIGPGMLKDIFNKMVPTQEILKIAQVTDTEIVGASAILKPSTYKVMEVEDKVAPLYCKT